MAHQLNDVVAGRLELVEPELLSVQGLRFRVSGDTTPCKDIPFILHRVAVSTEEILQLQAAQRSGFEVYWGTSFIRNSPPP